MKILLTNKLLCEEAKEFSQTESNYEESSLFGVTDGKAIGTYLEQKFQSDLAKKYEFEKGNSAKGIDFPELMVDIKVTSIKQPQSSCPFKSARQKIFGLGYSLLIFIYQKKDNNLNKTGQLNIIHTIYVDQSRTADYQTTSGIKKIIENDGNKDDLLAFFQERMLPVDDIEANLIAEELLEKSFNIGYLTISNALQWRLQYSRVIDKADEISGILRIK
ncbi:restriction endonuclease [Cyanobacterium aponinum]|uniref:restriction endonuclease n=1 Tax=Cyanobacterium aponinum TaxID=379064 RepID=UPI000C129E97|nr:restriction endonuclease [Cyanobacterium aponinum]PHV63537.1 restriction endonuclease [Cyanobacterium aponinum IPPAS B-1201]